MAEEKQDDEYEFLIPITLENKLQTFVSRYFLKYYKIIQQNGQICPQYIFQHTNKLLMIGIAKQHPIFTKQLKIKKINFLLCPNNEIKLLGITGKKKRGAIKVNYYTKVCEIITESGEIYYIQGMIQGNIIEFNEGLLSNPNILLEKPESDGFIFFAQGKSKFDSDQFCCQEKFEDQYQSALKANEESKNKEKTL